MGQRFTIAVSEYESRMSEMAGEIPPQRWERRERKKQAERGKMKKSGMSVRLLHQIIGQRAAEAKAKAERKLGKPSRR
jgi:hypothetical protein